MSADRKRNRAQMRQAAVARLRREGRPASGPKIGYKNVGRRGQKRIVGDEHKQWIIRQIVLFRDEEGLSWDQISDRVETLVAEQEGRRPRSRAFRTGWTLKTCWRAYHAAKAEQGEPRVTHRRCRDCRRSLPLARFEQTGKGPGNVCFRCQATRPIRTIEAQRQRNVRAALRLLRTVLADEGDPEKVRNVLQILVNEAGGADLAATTVALEVLRRCKHRPGSRGAFHGLETLFMLLDFAERAGGDSGTPDPAALSDSEIERDIRRLLQPTVNEILSEMQQNAPQV